MKEERKKTKAIRITTIKKKRRKRKSRINPNL